MEKVLLEDRIQRFLINYPGREYIPLHPDDFNILKFEGRLHDFPLPFKKLGEISLKDQ